MLLLDITIVNVALPDIKSELDASFSDVQWVVDAYALMLAALLLTAGSLADLLGRRRVFVVRRGVLHGRVAAVCAVRQLADADPRARRAGHRRRGDVRHLARAARAGVPRP